ncbi:MAG: hypothetical protein M1129_06740 [Candidatus Thermoplasmatota archaeon]|jgi:hypothetical protein|nr:hypothetical protein [Candidatus Thermoplasmatota archaeon]
MENTVPSGRGEFKPVETPPAAVEAGSPWIYSWEEVTNHFLHFIQASGKKQGIILEYVAAGFVPHTYLVIKEINLPSGS